MYLIQIDESTGLVLDCPTNDGWKAIKDFMNLYRKKGIKGITVIALASDYESPLRHYKGKDRNERACEEVFSKRHAMDFNDELVIKAMVKYQELQLDPDLETDRLNKEIKLRLIDKLSEANSADDDVGIEKYRKAMENHEKSITSFNLRFDRRNAMEKSATVNDYELSRIEADIKSRKKSKFVNHGDDLENPNQLGLSY